jgi:DNA (cytosine-5)-methyltransferase 1
LASLQYVRYFKPRFFVLENVSGLVEHDHDGAGNSTLSMFREAFSEEGYHVEWNVLNARYFGLPQSRPRVFVIGSLNGEKGLIPAHPKLPSPSFGDIMERGREDLAWGSTTYATAMEKIQRTGIGITVVEEKDRKPIRTIRDDHDFLPRNMFPTLTCGFGGGPTRKKCAVLDKTTSGVPFLRDPSPREGARAQGFPDAWQFPENHTHAWTLIGNAVASPVAEAIARHLIAISEGKSPKAKVGMSKDEVRNNMIRRQGDDLPPSIGYEEED